MKKLLLLIALSVFTLASPVGPTSPKNANAESDVELWSSVGVRKKLNKKWRVSLSQGLRLDDSIGRFGQTLTDLGATFRARRWLRFSAGYRFTYKQTTKGNLKVRHRFQADAQLRHRIGKLRLGYRLQFQDQIRDFDGGDGTRVAVRNRIKVGYRALKKLTPYLAGEVFVGDTDAGEFEHTKSRLTVGASYDLGKRSSVDVFYRLEVPADSAELTAHIIGLGYEHSL